MWNGVDEKPTREEPAEMVIPSHRMFLKPPRSGGESATKRSTGVDVAWIAQTRRPRASRIIHLRGHGSNLLFQAALAACSRIWIRLQYIKPVRHACNAPGRQMHSRCRCKPGLRLPMTMQGDSHGFQKAFNGIDSHASACARCYNRNSMNVQETLKRRCA
jgi:hypothetical protein